MGYYSDVNLICKNKAYEEIKKVWEENNLIPNTVKFHKDTNTYVVNWSWIKWYSCFPEIIAIESTLMSFDEKEPEEYSYKLLCIGEDDQPSEMESPEAYDYLCDYCISVYVNLAEPEDSYEEIPVEKKKAS